MMVLRTRAKEAVQVEFREISATGVFLAHTAANHRKSMAILQQNGFRPLTYQEAIVKIDQSPELKEQLKGNWFYLDGKGSQFSGYYTFNDKGELTHGKGDIEKTVYAYSGNKPLSLYLYVRTDGDASVYEGRYNLADYSPDGAARVVVGVQADHEVATQKTEPDLKTKLGAVVAQMEVGTPVTSEMIQVIKEAQRAVQNRIKKII